jgi:hypothetical protein
VATGDTEFPQTARARTTRHASHYSNADVGFLPALGNLRVHSLLACLEQALPVALGVALLAAAAGRCIVTGGDIQRIRDQSSSS